MALHIAHKNKILDSLRHGVQSIVHSYSHETRRLANDAARELEQCFGDASLWQSFAQKIKPVISDIPHDNYMAFLADTFPMFIAIELRIAALLRMRLGTAEIAAVLGITERRVLRHCRDMGTKLGVPMEKDINDITNALLQEHYPEPSQKQP